MIISHKHKFIFFAVPKTGTHAIRKKLQPYLGDDDWEQENLFHKKRLPIPELAAKNHGHLSVKEVSSSLPPELWKSYYKFAIVRNPFDRYVSTCFFLFRKNANFLAQPIINMKRLIQRPQFKQRILSLPQSQLLLNTKNKIDLNYCGKYEDLHNSFSEICKEVGLPNINLDKVNVSKHKAYSKYYDDELTQMVYEYYKSDFDYFDYSSKINSEAKN